MNNKGAPKQHIIVDVGPYSMLMGAELVLIVLKIMGYISYSWSLVLSPIMLTVLSASCILLFTFLKVLKNYFFK